jgi:hypothetical protein
LRAHDVVCEVGNARRRRSSHFCWNHAVIACRPADRRQVKARILRIAVVCKSRDASIESKHGGGRETVGVTGSKRVAVVVLRAAVCAQPCSQWIDGQIHDVPIVESQKQSLLVGEVVVDTRHNLVVVASCGSGGGEIVCARVWIVGRRPKIQQFFRGEVQPACGNDVVQKWSGRCRASGTSALRVYKPSARIINLIDHHGLAVCSDSSVIADPVRETGFTQRRKIAGSFACVGHCSSERLLSSQAESFQADEPECLVDSARVRNIQRAAGISAELILNPRRLRSSNSIQEKIVGIKDLVSQIFVDLAVHRTGSSFGAEVCYSARKLSPLRP